MLTPAQAAFLAGLPQRPAGFNPYRSRAAAMARQRTVLARMMNAGTLPADRWQEATAERLTLHKNSVQYRVRKAEESLGRPIGEDRLSVELALLASQWLGAAVLRQAGAARS